MTSNRLYGPLEDVSGDAGYSAGHPQRVGFFTDTSVCIGCKACEVACKEWNGLPDPESDLLAMTGMSYDNTGALGSNSWRHVAFIEQAVPPSSALSRDENGELIISAPVDGPDADAGATRWLMASDVCKHCTHAGCLDVCPTGALVRTEFGTVIVQPDVCNGCAYCVSACPFGVIDRREDDGRAWKCTMCYDRLRGGLEPACAKACPTESIQFGPLEELRATAQARLSELHAAGVTEARLYGADPQDGIGGAGAFFLLLDEPQVYGLPPDPVVTTKDLPSMWRWAGLAAGVVVAGVAAAFARPGGTTMTEQLTVPPAEFESYYGQPILKVTRWREPHLPAYLFLGELSGAAAVLAAMAGTARRPGLALAGKLVAAAAAQAGAAFLTAELGRPERFLNMLRVAKPTSPMSMGSWILVSHSGLTAAAAASSVTGRLTRTGAAATAGSAVTGPLLAAYPGVLLANTAVPAWHSSHRELPMLFAGGALTAAAATGLAAGAITGDPGDLGPARRLALIGAAVENAAEFALERRTDIAAEPYHDGAGGMMLRGARATTLLGAVAALGARRSRVAAVTAAALLAGGGLLAKFAVLRAGVASAQDPKYVVQTQTSGRDRS